MEQFVDDRSYELIVLKGSPDYTMYKVINEFHSDSLNSELGFWVVYTHFELCRWFNRFIFQTSNQTLMKKMMSLMKPEHLLPQTYEQGFEEVS